MRHSRVLLLCAALTLAALALFSYKAAVLKFPVLPDESANSWLFEAKIRFSPQYKQPIKLHFYKAQGTNTLALVNETIVASAYGVTETVGEKTRNRRMTLTRREARLDQTVFYQALFYEIQSSDQPAAENTASVSVSLPRRATQGPVLEALQDLAAEARAKSADHVGMALEALKILNNGADDRVIALKQNLSVDDTLSELLTFVMGAGGIPARVVNGVELKEYQRNAPFLQWIEVYTGGKWRPVDVVTARAGIPANRVPIWRGGRLFAEVEGGQNLRVDVSMKYNRESAVTLASWQARRAARWIAEWSLFSLPVDTQIMFGIILMIPIGGLVIAFLRQVVGIPTYGTFMPVLVALSFRETGVIWGIVLFSMIVAVGLFLRAYFERLRLLVVPRLTAVLTIVVLLIAALTMLAFKLNVNAGLSITLFPMIILTMMIERMALMTEEFGAREARKSAYGSLAAAVLSYAAMSAGAVRHLVFVFPELLLVVLAATILLGRYNGYKLSEYFRFRKLARAIAEEEAK